MRKRSLKLVSSILWFLTAGCWIFVLCMDFNHGSRDGLVMVIHALIAIISLANAVFNLYVYRKNKGEIL